MYLNSLKATLKINTLPKYISINIKRTQQYPKTYLQTLEQYKELQN